MSIFTQEYDPDQHAGFTLAPATRRPSSWGKRFSAGVIAGRIEDDSWDQAARVEREYVAEIERDLAAYRGPDFERTGRSRPVLPDGESYIPGMQSPSLNPEGARQQKRRELMSLIAGAKADNPEKWAHLPDSPEAYDDEVIKRRQAEYDEAIAVLNSAPGDAWFGAEFAGRGWAGMTDEVSIATLPLGGPAAKGAWGLAKFVAAEALLGGASELAIAPRRQEVARDLDVPEPDIVTDVLMAAATSGGFAGALAGLAKGLPHAVRGAQRYLGYRSDRAAAAGAATPPGLSPGQNEGRIRRAGETLATGQAATAAPTLPAIAADAPANWQAIRGGIFAGESGGDYNALFGYSNRDGGPFAKVKITEMTVDQAIEFSNPRGEYAAWVRGKIGRTATPMGAYQIVGTTLRGAKKALGLRGDELMTPELQERLGQFIYRAQGTGAWEGYRGPRADFQPGEAGHFAGDGAPAYQPTTRGYTGAGQVVAGERRLDVEYVVVDASLLTKAAGRFQPRDRSRINSDAWIAETAARLDPALLMPSPTAAHGAPLVGPDMMIESGNGRFSVIDRAYDLHPDRAEAYKAAIKAQGFEIPEGVERPVLVAKRLTSLTDDERVQVAIDAQDGGTARMTATERARATARDMTAERLAGFDPAARIGDDANRPFLQSVLSGQTASERNALFDKGGALNADGRRMMKNAFFARAWDDGSPIGSDILDRYAEAEDAGELKSLMEALDEAAPAMATLKAEIEAGTVRPEFDITPHVLDAIGAIMQARRDAGRIGSSVAEAIEVILGHDDLFAGPNPLSIALLRKFWREGRAAPAAEVARFLNRYANEARAAGRTGDLMGATPSEVLRAIDAKTFGDLPDEIPAVVPAPIPRVEGAALPETAFAKGADSPEAEAADRQALEDLRSGFDAGSRLAQMAVEDADYAAALARQGEVQPTTDLDGYGTDDFWQHRTYRGADGQDLVGRDAAVGYLKDKARALAWSDEGLPPEKVRSERLATIVIGAPAAGKSTVANPLARERGAAIVDADEAKKIIPEFGRGDGASAVHEESGELASRLLEEMLVAGDNVLLPKVGGKAGSIERTIAILREAGYRVELIEVSTEPAEAVARMMGRGRASGRFIPPDIMADGIDGAPRTYQYLKEKNLADEYARIENTPGLDQPRGILEDQGDILSALRRGNGADRPAPGGRSAGTPEGATGSEGQPAGITNPTPVGQRGAEDDLSAAIAARRAEFEDLGDFELPDGTRASDLLADIDEDQNLLDVLDACLIGGNRP